MASTSQFTEKINVELFQRDLVSWFKNEKRDLPWRKVSDPYKIWVSEIMLQQTRVDTVIPYYERFLKQYPTMESFAAADEEAVLKIWEGLGYYSRVRNLHEAVQEVVEKYDGKVPQTRKEISKLKGVGPYTAGAILSIAYGKPEPAVDGNVMRVLSRILLIKEDIAKASSRKVFESAVRQLMYERNPSYFNQALMELGALICTPTSPACLLCPVMEHCNAFSEGVQEELPVKTRKKSTRHENLAAVILRDSDGKILIRKRPPQGLLAHLWEFPNVEMSPFTSTHHLLKDFCENELAAEVKIETGAFVTVDHAFTHLTWTIDAYFGEIIKKGEKDSSFVLVNPEQVDEYAFPVSHQKIWKAFNEKQKLK